MRAVVTRSTDAAMLYLMHADDAWRVVAVVASGCVVDAGIRCLVGRRLAAGAVLAWAAGAVTSEELLSRAEQIRCPCPAE